MFHDPDTRGGGDPQDVVAAVQRLHCPLLGVRGEPLLKVGEDQVTPLVPGPQELVSSCQEAGGQS